MTARTGRAPTRGTEAEGARPGTPSETSAASETRLDAALGEVAAGTLTRARDHLLGIWGATEVTGKPVMADLRARKKSLPVVAALTSGTPEAVELKALLAREDELSEEDLARAADLIVAAGGKAWAEKEADDRLAAAAASLDGIGVPADVRAEFIAIAEFITARQW